MNKTSIIVTCLIAFALIGAASVIFLKNYRKALVQHQEQSIEAKIKIQEQETQNKKILDELSIKNENDIKTPPTDNLEKPTRCCEKPNDFIHDQFDLDHKEPKILHKENFEDQLIEQPKKPKLKN